MYQTLKRFLPPTLRRRYAPALRALAALPYRGGTYQCNLCGTGLRTFIELPTGDLLCPRCGSLPRTRRLGQLLTEQLDINDLRLLHLSPSQSLASFLHPPHPRPRPNGGTDRLKTYVTSDYAGEFAADERYDLTAVDAPDASFDIVLCYHVLEHISDDGKAMRELHRILAPGGLALVQTPFSADERTHEDPKLTTPEQRLAAYGQADHVRLYGAPDLAQRLRNAGFRVLSMTYPVNHRLGLRGGETVLFAERK